MKKALLLLCTTITLFACAGSAQFTRETNTDGELTLTGNQRSAWEDAQQKVHEVCGGPPAKMEKNIASPANAWTGAQEVDVVHYECPKAGK